MLKENVHYRLDVIGILTDSINLYFTQEVNANTNSRSIILSDAESGMIETVRVFLPADFPIGFSELGKRNEEDDEEDY